MNLVAEPPVSSTPDWIKFEHAGVIPQGSARLLSQLDHVDTPTVKTVFSNRPEVIAAVLSVFANLASETTPALYLLSVVGESCRADSAIWDIIAKSDHAKNIWNSVFMLLRRPGIDTVTTDKAISLLSAVVAHAKSTPSEIVSVEQIQALVAQLVSPATKATTINASRAGVMEAIGNLLKVDKYRTIVCSSPGVMDLLLVHPAPASSAELYRSMLALWVASFNQDVVASILSSESVRLTAFLKSTLEECRVEKVLRMSLAVVKNTIACPSIAERFVEENILNVVQPLEFDKWRDSELYDDIRAVSALIANEVGKHSSFERYEKELLSKRLAWGFIHSEKFWLENVKNFEKDNFSAIVNLIALLDSQDATTQAVACHDLGEFARLHASGKRVIAKFNGKDKVMSLMSHNNREVSKEALLCTQKLMLNQWQKLSSVTANKK